MTEILKSISFKTKNIYIYWGFWYVYRWSRRVDSHFRTVLYRYAIVREIVAFANFTINFFFAPNNNGFFSKMSKNMCIFSAKWLFHEAYKPLFIEFKGDNRNAYVFYVTNLLTLKSHMKGTSEKWLWLNECIKSFFHPGAMRFTSGSIQPKTRCK